MTHPHQFKSLSHWAPVAALAALPMATHAVEVAPTPAPAEAAVTAPAEPPKSTWETTAALGVTLTRGNSETLLVTANVLSVAKWQQNELRTGADATYGEDHSVANAESLHGFIQYNRLFGQKAFVYGRVDGLHDGIADIDYRVALSPGAGYYFIRDKQTELSAEVGPGYVFERKGDRDFSYLTLRVGQRFDHKFNDRVRVWESLEWLPKLDDLNNYQLNAEIGVESALTKKLKLRVYAQDVYYSEPAPGRESNDVKLVSALAYTF